MDFIGQTVSEHALGDVILTTLCGLASSLLLVSPVEQYLRAGAKRRVATLASVATVVYVAVLAQNRNHRKPSKAATSEASSIAIFEAVMIAGSAEKARLVINIDIVKPMPPSSPAPKMCDHCTSGGKRHIPTATAAKQSIMTPRGLPAINPAAMPMLFALASC